MRLGLWLFCITVRVSIIVLIVHYYDRVYFSTPSAYLGLLASGGFLWSDLIGKQKGFFGYERWWISFPHAVCYFAFYALLLNQNRYAYVPLLTSLSLSVVSQIFHTTRLFRANQWFRYHHRRCVLV